MKRILLLVCALVAFVAVVGCFKRPAVKLENSGSSVIVHVETLGEYATTVRHIRLKEASSGKVIFELLTGKWNTADLQFSALERGQPYYPCRRSRARLLSSSRAQREEHLRPQTGVRYRLTIWGNGWPPSKTDLKF
jgi:hypothetical protein